MRRLISLLLLATSIEGAVVLDRMAVIVGNHVVKASDIDRDLRVTEFLNNEPLNLDAAAKHQSAERLIDQEIIRQEIITGGYRRPTDEDAAAFEQQLLRNRFHGSAEQLSLALTHYGLAKEELHLQLLWQLTVLRFIDQRFRAGVLVTDEEVRAYYDQHLAELRGQNLSDSSFDALQSKIRTTLEGNLINKNFNEWLEQSRKRSRIEYRPGALQ
jgi:peptidyl-prolyl cis-trans isomerase SurA